MSVLLGGVSTVSTPREVHFELLCLPGSGFHAAPSRGAVLRPGGAILGSSLCTTTSPLSGACVVVCHVEGLAAQQGLPGSRGPHCPALLWSPCSPSPWFSFC